MVSDRAAAARGGGSKRCGRAAVLAITAGFLGAAPGVAGAAEIAPHRALYSMTLGSTRNDSGVTDARGTMAYEWGESCEGWIVEQRYRLKMHYAESRDVEIVSNFVTWEAKDGLRYRFNQKETRNGDVDEETRGNAHLDGAGKSGVAEFEKPHPETMHLAPGVLFPSAHTILLIDSAVAGESFLSRQMFDGSTFENAVQVSAVIGSKAEPDRKLIEKGALLNRPGWHMRLAFFPADQNVEKPDYELGMTLLDNGVSADMLIDYGDYSIKAKLDDIEPLPKTGC